MFQKRIPSDVNRIALTQDVDELTVDDIVSKHRPVRLPKKPDLFGLGTGLDRFCIQIDFN